MRASSSDDCERIEGHVAVSAMVGGGQHAQPERMLTRQARLLGAQAARCPFQCFQLLTRSFACDFSA